MYTNLCTKTLLAVLFNFTLLTWPLSESLTKFCPSKPCSVHHTHQSTAFLETLLNAFRGRRMSSTCLLSSYIYRGVKELYWWFLFSAIKQNCMSKISTVLNNHLQYLHHIVPSIVPLYIRLESSLYHYKHSLSAFTQILRNTCLNHTTVCLPLIHSPTLCLRTVPSS